MEEEFPAKAQDYQELRWSKGEEKQIKMGLKIKPKVKVRDFLKAYHREKRLMSCLESEFNNCQSLGSYVVEKGGQTIDILYAEKIGGKVVFTSDYSKAHPVALGNFERFILKYGFALCE